MRAVRSACKEFGAGAQVRVSVRYPGDGRRLRAFFQSRRRASAALTGSAYSFVTSSLPRPCVLPTPVGCALASSIAAYRRRSRAGSDAPRSGGSSRRANIARPARGDARCLILTQGSDLALLTTKGRLAALPTAVPRRSSARVGCARSRGRTCRACGCPPRTLPRLSSRFLSFAVAARFPLKLVHRRGRLQAFQLVAGRVDTRPAALRFPERRLLTCL